MRGTARVLLALTIGLGACKDEPVGREETGLEALGLSDINPRVILPGSRIEIEGQSFLDRPLGISWLRVDGLYAGGPIDAYIPAEFVDFERLQIDATPSVLGLWGAASGTFSGQVQVEVDFVLDGTRHASVPLTVQLEVAEHLEPVLDRVEASPTIFVNEPIEIHGSGLLLGEGEGTTYAVVEGCFSPTDGPGSCVAIDPVQVPVRPATPFDREHGIFAFSPRIAGIRAGQFMGQVSLRNEHADGEVSTSASAAMAYQLEQTRIAWVGGEDEDAVGTLGKYIAVGGDGFVGPDDGGGTVLRFSGSYRADEGSGDVPVELEIVPEFVDGRTVRYVVNEEDALAQVIDVREARGRFIGDIVPRVEFEGDEVEGPQTPVSFRLEPVKQVVYLQFNPTYVESLRLFGLRALDSEIRARVRAVLERDYEAINIEIRDEPPLDYALFSTIEIAGPDPNGLGLLGYDNTPGKDVGNERLNDRIGGVNAQTLEGGLPGFGGVFMESLFTFSHHPPTGTSPASELSTTSFDQIFDPLRPDGGQPVTSEDFRVPIPTLSSGVLCPARDRGSQIACGVFVLGSVVGSTVSHELGHSLGLADPLGQTFHNAGDEPNRLMDAGSARSFEERAQLRGLGPSRLCVDAYEYLRDILPTEAPDPEIERPPC